MPEDKRICPVCDTPLEKGETKCPICGADINSIDQKSLEEIDISALKDKTKVIDDILNLLEEEEKKVKEKIEVAPEKTPAKKVEPLPEQKKEEKAEKETAPEEEKKEVGQEKVATAGEKEAPEERKEKKEMETTPAPQATFTCPVCHEEIPADSTTCPRCGAIFEEAVVFECPVCHTEVPVEANTCPKCGAIFVEDESQAASETKEKESLETVQSEAEKGQITKMEPAPPGASSSAPQEAPQAEKSVQGQPQQETKEKGEISAEKTPVKKVEEKKVEDLAKELASKVSEAKILLETMRKLGVEEKDIKENISKSLSAGKEKNYNEALKIMDGALQDGKKRVMEKIGKLVVELKSEIASYTALGCDVRKGLGLCERTLFALETENFENSVRLYTTASDYAKVLRGTYEQIKKDFDALMRTIEEYKSFGVPGIEDLKNRIEQAKNAYAGGKKEEGDKIVMGVRETLTSVLPDYVTKRIADQAAKLREAKLLGMDVKDKIEYLKEANICVKKKDYAQALVWVNKIDREE